MAHNSFRPLIVVIFFAWLQSCEVARFMSDDQLCTFDGEHGSIRDHIDIDGYFYVGDKDNCENETFRYIMFFDDGSFSNFYWKEIGPLREDPFKYTGVEDIDIKSNISKPYENSSILCRNYELTGGAYKIKGDTIICESTFKNFLYSHGRQRVRQVFRIVDRCTLEPVQLSINSKHGLPITYDAVEMKARWGDDGLYHFVRARNLPEPKDMYCKNKRFMWKKGRNFRRYKRERAAYKKARRKELKAMKHGREVPKYFTRGDHTYKFDDEHGDITSLIDIDGYYFIGEKSDCTDWDGRFLIFFSDGSFSNINWRRPTLALPTELIGVPDIDLGENLTVYNSKWTGSSYTGYPKLTGGTYIIKGDTIITEYVAPLWDGFRRKHLFTRSYKVVDRHTLDPIHWTKRTEKEIVYDVDCSVFKYRYGDGLYHFVPAVNLPSSADMSNKRKSYMWNNRQKWKDYLKERKIYLYNYKMEHIQ